MIAKILFILYFSFSSYAAYSMPLKNLIVMGVLTGMETSAFVGRPVFNRYMSNKIVNQDTRFTKNFDLGSRNHFSSFSEGGWDDPAFVTPQKHVTALPSHYDERPDHYDIFNEENSIGMNERVVHLLEKHTPLCSSILDVTCGTGSQFFSLTHKGYKVTGSDISEKMLEVAREKAIKHYPALVSNLHHADMRFVKLGRFDGAISMFNAVGHLTKEDFELAMRNIASNLNKGGVYIFDIFNADYLRHGSNISKLTIDFIKSQKAHAIREIQYSDIDSKGVLASYTLRYQTDPLGNHAVSRNVQTLQVYTAEELANMLQQSGFKVIEQCGIDGEKISPTETERLFTIASKI
ncbi:MAG: class I SAM-dependent methyltransferase [Candidatus Paracaedibacteraceae bacterium]|nr:class I SAM-dependent methyltransferase [Candidatus Paracaedibacteraceae bacterium]